MLNILLVVIILGIIAYAIQQLPMPNPFRVVAWCILAIILVIMLFRIIGVAVPTL